jgi:hypothetical protein
MGTCRKTTDNLRLIPTSDVWGDIFYQLEGNIFLRVRTVGVGPHPRGATVGDRHPQEGLAKGYAKGIEEPLGDLKVITRFFGFISQDWPFQ